MTLKSNRILLIALPAFLALLLCGFFNAYAFAADEPEGLAEKPAATGDVGDKAENKVAKNETPSAFVLKAVPYNAIRAGARELTISGGEEGVDYTYDDGVLTIIKDGSYTIGMAEGVTSTTHRVVIDKENHDITDLSLTLDNVTIDSAVNGAISVNYITSGTPADWNLELTLKGSSTLTAPNHPIRSSRNYMCTTIKGDGSLKLVATESPEGYNNFNNKNLTIESGKLILDNSTIMCVGDMQMNGGSITAGSIENDGSITAGSIDAAIYINGSFEMTDGSLDLTCNGDGGCIHMVGMNGGDLSFNVTGGEIKANYTGGSTVGAIIAGTRGPVNVTFATDKTVDIDSKTLGVLLWNNSNLTVGDGTVTIDAMIGVYPYTRTGSNTTEVHFNGGETEITSTSRAIVLQASSSQDPKWGDDYFHKNYSGTTAGNREEISDPDLTGDSGNTDKYVLVTPAWPIEYDLGDGALEPGVTNPEKYSRVDSFPLNNPVPNKSFLRFIGWTGTGLEEPTINVTVPEKSKGRRTYVANYESLLEKVDRVEPTCNEPGNIEYWIYPEDGSIYLDEAGEQPATKAETVLKALGHDWSDWVVTKKPTTTEEGVKTRTCKRDPSHVQTESIPKVNPPEPGPEPEPEPTPPEPGPGPEPEPNPPAPSPKPKPTPSNGGGSSASKSAIPAAGDDSALVLGILALAAIGLGTAAGAHAAARKDR